MRRSADRGPPNVQLTRPRCSFRRGQRVHLNDRPEAIRPRTARGSGSDGRQVGAGAARGRGPPARAWATATMATRVGEPSRASAGTTRASGERASGLRLESTRAAAGTPAARAAATAAWATRDSRPMAMARTAPPGPRASSQARAAGSSDGDGRDGAAGAREALLDERHDGAGVPLAGDHERGARRRGRRRSSRGPGASGARRRRRGRGARRPGPASRPSAENGRPSWRSPGRGGRPGRWARRTMRCISG